MKDREDLKLKAELEEIMENVYNIMKKIETVMPEKEEDAHPHSD